MGNYVGSVICVSLWPVLTGLVVFLFLQTCKGRTIGYPGGYGLKKKVCSADSAKKVCSHHTWKKIKSSTNRWNVSGK